MARAILAVVGVLAAAGAVAADDRGWDGKGKAGGIGVLGDSYSDEYQFYPPDRSLARNWVEILAATRGLDFGPFTTEDRGTPRHQGFAYNWARSDATTADMIAEGQHTGLAAQVARGEVGLVVVFIGGNDVIHALRSSDPAGALEGLVPRMTDNLRTALDTILGASPEVRLVVATVPDVGQLPEFRQLVREGSLRSDLLERATATLHKYNARIKLLALDPRRFERVAVLDLDLDDRLANAVEPGRIRVAGRAIDRLVPSNDPGHFFLADGRHTGTVGQAMMGRLILEAINARFKTGIASLAGPEILEFSESLVPAPAGPNPTDAGDDSLLVGGGR